MAKPQDFLLNTDYEMDKIILVKEGLMDGPGTVTVPHKLPFRPLVFGLCSFNSDFSVPKPSPFRQDPEYIGSPTPYIRYRVSFTMYAEGNNINITYSNLNSSSTPIYYRIYAFEPSDRNEKLPPTKNYATLFSINTDNDYRKLYKKGHVEIGKTVTFQHDFGYIPQVMLWYDLPNFGEGGYATNVFSISDTNENQLYASNREVKIQYPAQQGDMYNNAKIYYRIYYDEA